jgi:hypothetical protein
MAESILLIITAFALYFLALQTIISIVGMGKMEISANA